VRTGTYPIMCVEKYYLMPLCSFVLSGTTLVLWHCTHFFEIMNRDMGILQNGVLGKALNFPRRVLLMDREGMDRHWLHSHRTKASIESIRNGKSTHISNLVDVKLIANPSGSFVDQAREMHSADIIIASHGAALTNIAFIRSCTAVLELFPFGSYIGFFQPLLLAGEGIPYDGYLSTVVVWQNQVNVKEDTGKSLFTLRQNRFYAPFQRFYLK